MKVLALVVLVIAVSGLEAGIVKREVPNMPSIEDLTKYLQSIADTIKVGTQEWIDKIKAGELQTQAEQYYEQTKAHAEPFASELHKIINEWAENAKKTIYS